LAKNTLIATKAENLEQLKKRTRDALDNFGPVTGYEVVETIEIGKSLFRQTCISLNEDLPLRWRFYFYRTGENGKSWTCAWTTESSNCSMMSPAAAGNKTAPPPRMAF
jgi:hypothetical protein